MREMLFSLRLPKQSDGFVFCVTDKNHPEFNGFNALEGHSFNDLE